MHFQVKLIIFCAHGTTAYVGPGSPYYQASRSDSDTLHSVGLLWTSDQPDPDLYLTTQNTHNRHRCLSAGLEPTFPASELQQTHALDRAVTEIGDYKMHELDFE